MKNNIITQKILATALLTAACSTFTMAQLPDSFSYQAVVNAEDGSPVAGKQITVEISILQGTDCDKGGSCPVLWQELHYPTTNDFGMFSIEIGASDAVNTTAGKSSKYSDIDWLNTAEGYYYLKVRADFGESEYLNSLSDLGITKFSAVPYALAAQKADNAKTAVTANTALALQTGNDGKIKHTLSQLEDVDAADPQDNQILTFANGKWTPTTPKTVEVVVALNELTDVSINTPAKDQILTWNGTKWINADAPKTVTAVKQLTDDVNINDPQENQILTYDKKGYWKNAFPAQWTTAPHGIIYTQGWVGISDDKDNYKDPSALFEIKKGSSSIRFGKGLAMGSTSEADGEASIALGSSEAHTKNSIAVGNYSRVMHGGGNAGGENSVAIGSNNLVKGDNSMAVGKNNTIENGDNSFTFGEGLNDTGHNGSVTVGQYNATDANALFTVGNGSSSTKSNAFVVYADGTATLKGANLTSDSRLKSNITPLAKSLEKVMKLNGVTFNWDKSKPQNFNASSTLQYGFIAQELEKVIPELVTNDAQGFKSINYIGVIPVLTQAIQEQQQEIEQLKEENQKLNDTLQSLLKRIEALENK